MRTKELKPGIKYATEGGACVETSETVERGWYQYRVTEKGKPETVQITKGLPGDSTPENDPWDTSRPSNRRYTRVGNQLLRDVVEGVKVLVHRVDGEGNSVSSEEHVVDPKHIKGTWEDYVRLHGDVLRGRQYRRDAEEAAKAESLRLSDLAKAAGLVGEDVKIHVDIYYRVPDRRHPKDETEVKYLGTGQVALGYRLQASMTVTGQEVENLLNDSLSAGH